MNKEQKEKVITAEHKYENNVLEPLRKEMWKLIADVSGGKAYKYTVDQLRDIKRAGEIATAILDSKSAMDKARRLID